TGSLWPDIIVAGIMATLGMTAGYQVVSKALSERKKSVLENSTAQ
ncbi:MAG: cation transporter, partial [Acinetobacter sp.]